VGEDEHGHARPAARAVGSPPWEREVVGPPPGDHGAQAGDSLLEDGAVALVAAERPLDEALAAVAESVIGGVCDEEDG
jgi:hypothetical protein